MREFLRRYPNDRMTADAHYWLGESLYPAPALSGRGRILPQRDDQISKPPPRRPTRCCGSANRSPPSARRKWPAPRSAKSAANIRAPRSREAGRRAGIEACPLLTRTRPSPRPKRKRFSPVFHNFRRSFSRCPADRIPPRCLYLAARWRAGLKTGPALVAVTVDHGLRAQSARRGESRRSGWPASSASHTGRCAGAGASPKPACSRPRATRATPCWRRKRERPARAMC